MLYNPIFEEENLREQELLDLKKAIKTRASNEQIKEVYQKTQRFIKSHPIFTTLALGLFGLSFKKRNFLK